MFVSIPAYLMFRADNFKRKPDFSFNFNSISDSYFTGRY
jgi:hypothetical protein